MATESTPNLPAGVAPRPSWTVLPGRRQRPDPPATVLDYLCERFSRIDRDVWRDRMERGLVIDADGRALGLDFPYVGHLRVGYYRELKAEPVIPFEVEILYRSEHLLVVDKPPFLPVAPVGRFVNQCLIYRLERATGLKGIAPIHRLDRMTSGIVLLSADPQVRRAYAELFARRRVHKTYLALGHAAEAPTASRWTVRSRIEEAEPWFRRRSAPDGEPNSHTEARLEGWDNGVGRFHLEPVTGKTHQLRVHMQDLGFPILRDPLYPVLQPEVPDDFSTPMALIAHRLRLRDPMEEREREWVSHWTFKRLGFPSH